MNLTDEQQEIYDYLNLMAEPVESHNISSMCGYSYYRTLRHLNGLINVGLVRSAGRGFYECT